MKKMMKIIAIISLFAMVFTMTGCQLSLVSNVETESRNGMTIQHTIYFDSVEDIESDTINGFKFASKGVGGHYDYGWVLCIEPAVADIDDLQEKVTLTVGGAGLLAAALVNRLGGETTRGIVSTGYADLSLGQAIAQPLAAWLIFASLLYLAARMLSKSRIRIVDLYGNQLLARIALLPVVLIGALPSLRTAALQLAETAPQELAAHLPTGLICYGFATLLFLVWFYIIYGATAGMPSPPT